MTCAIVRCARAAVKAGFCALCHEWAYVVLKDERYRYAETPPTAPVEEREKA